MEKKNTRTEEVLKIWKNHFYEHLNTEFPRDESAIQNLPKIVTNLESSDDLTITRDEIRKAVSSLKNNKVPGADAITAAVLKARGEPVVAMLEWIFKRILAEQDTPKHFAKMLLTPILKKGDKDNPANYRAIVLLSIPGKVLNKILLKKIQEHTEIFSSERQFGFRPNRGTVDAIFIIRQLMQKSKERGMQLNYHFIDFKSAFDTIWRNALWKMMYSIGINQKIIQIIKSMYGKSTCAVMIDGRLTKWFEVTVGVRQGCLLSPTLFNLFLDFAMMELKCLQDRVSLDNDLCFDVRYADDTTLVAAVFDKLQLSTDQLLSACQKYGMKVNVSKCKVISLHPNPVIICNNAVESVEEFTFLGSVVPTTSSDIRRRVALANSAFGRLKKNVWSRKDVSTSLKLRLYKALVLPIAIYGSETWCMTQRDSEKLSVFENNCVRSILGVKLKDKISLRILRAAAKIDNPIENVIRKRRLTWFGHICRLTNESLVKRMMKEDFLTKRRRGRPPKRWQDLIKADTGLPLATAERYAQDRKLWNKNVNTKWAKPLHGVCN